MRTVQTLLQSVREILFREWDPFGVNRFEDAHAEYDSYGPTIVRFLMSGTDENKLVSWLREAQTERMGMSVVNDDVLQRVAQHLLALVAETPSKKSGVLGTFPRPTHGSGDASLDLTDILSVEHLSEWLGLRPMVFPRIACGSIRPEDAEIIEKVGLPKNFAVFFIATNEITQAFATGGVTYLRGGRRYTCRAGYTIAESSVQRFVVDTDTGFVIGLRDVEASFFSSSLGQMLYRMAAFWASADCDYFDVHDQLESCKVIDPGAFEDPNSWSILFEEAIDGMF